MRAAAATTAITMTALIAMYVVVGTALPVFGVGAMLGEAVGTAVGVGAVVGVGVVVSCGAALAAGAPTRTCVSVNELK